MNPELIPLLFVAIGLMVGVVIFGAFALITGYFHDRKKPEVPRFGRFDGLDNFRGPIASADTDMSKEVYNEKRDCGYARVEKD